MPLRVLVPVVACAALVGIAGALLVTWHLRRRRRQRRIALPLSPIEKGVAIIHDDDGDGPAIWDNRPPAMSPIPPPLVIGRGIDSPEYSPTATVFSPNALAFPPTAMDKHNEMAKAKVYEPYTYSISPPSSPPMIVVDRELAMSRGSFYSTESFYSPSPSPVPSSEPGMRVLTPDMLDTFPAPPPLAHSAHRSISVRSLRHPLVEPSHMRIGSDESQLSPTNLHFVASRSGAEHASRVYLPPTSTHFQFPPRHPPPSPHSPPSAFSLQTSAVPRRQKYAPSRKQRSLQSSRNSLDIIRERG
ncbi:hypothetical protein EXIGLDRAFT_737569, partial [Exidia glandulosa HHB12029]